ncbi:MAG: hypothetical protein JWM57_4034 [Phycisphaerales bacterium]|nr:hypothetical protein [Phycisphaerales bacterium]
MEIAEPNRQGRIRRRGVYALWLAVVVLAGLGSRVKAVGLPHFVSKYAGDALWALMILVGLGLLWPRGRTGRLAAVAALICAGVECSQLYHAPWIDGLRRTFVGHLVLGDTFGWGDLAAYAVGIVVGAGVESAVCFWRRAAVERRAI